MINNVNYVESLQADRNMKYTLPQWMKDEHMENCDEFVRDYYRTIADRFFHLFNR